MGIEERLVFFPCGSLSLAGVLSVPSEPNGMVVMIPWGAGAYPSSGRNRIRTRMARALAEQGFHTFRFDYQGVGESEGHFRERDLNEPYGDDIVAASNWLTSEGHKRIVVVGNCFGGWSSLLSAPSIVGLEALAVINTPVRRDHIQVAGTTKPLRWWIANLKRVSLKKLRTAEGRARYRKMIGAKAVAMMGTGKDDARFTSAVTWLVDREIPLLLVYGRGGFRSDFEVEMDRGLRRIIEQAGPPTRFIVLEDLVAGYATLTSQEVVLQEIGQWLNDLPILHQASATPLPRHAG